VVAQLTYDLADRLTELKRYQPGSGGSGGEPFVRTVQGYDAAWRTTGIRHEHVSAGGVVTPVADYRYSCSAASQVAQYSGPEGVTNYSYDPLGQLTDVTDGAGNLVEYYRYTPNGNRTASHLHGTGHLTGADNWLLSDGTYNYEYDGEGNLIRKTNPVTREVTQYWWDYRNRQTDVVHRDGAGNVLWEVHYRYDAFNRRIASPVDPDGAGPQPQSMICCNRPRQVRWPNVVGRPLWMALPAVRSSPLTPWAILATRTPPMG
jgi:YD repeat-containing protein